jgi:hypothetical protein
VYGFVTHAPLPASHLPIPLAGLLDHALYVEFQQHFVVRDPRARLLDLPRGLPPFLGERAAGEEPLEAVQAALAELLLVCLEVTPLVPRPEVGA